MTDAPTSVPPKSWRQSVAPHRRHPPIFSSSTVSMGAMIHMAGMIVGALATDRMKDPSTRWATIAGFGVATGIGETIWRERIEREREINERFQAKRSRLQGTQIQESGQDE